MIFQKSKFFSGLSGGNTGTGFGEGYKASVKNDRVFDILADIEKGIDGFSGESA